MRGALDIDALLAGGIAQRLDQRVRLQMLADGSHLRRISIEAPRVPDQLAWSDVTELNSYSSVYIYMFMHEYSNVLWVATSWPPQEKLFIWSLFFQYNKRLLRQKIGGACLYMPQDGHWLASFEVILPPKKLVFPRPKNQNENSPLKTVFLIQFFF